MEIERDSENVLVASVQEYQTEIEGRVQKAPIYVCIFVKNSDM